MDIFTRSLPLYILPNFYHCMIIMLSKCWCFRLTGHQTTFSNDTKSVCQLVYFLKKQTFATHLQKLEMHICEHLQQETIHSASTSQNVYGKQQSAPGTSQSHTFIYINNKYPKQKHGMQTFCGEDVSRRNMVVNFFFLPFCCRARDDLTDFTGVWQSGVSLGTC